MSTVYIVHACSNYYKNLRDALYENKIGVLNIVQRIKTNVYKGAV